MGMGQALRRTWMANRTRSFAGGTSFDDTARQGIGPWMRHGKKFHLARKAGFRGYWSGCLSVGLAEAARRAEVEGVSIELIQADLYSFDPSPSSYDLVVVANIHPLPEEAQQLYGMARKALKRGEHLFVIGHHLEMLGHHGPPDPTRLYTEDSLRKSLPPDLLIELLQRVERAHGSDIGSQRDISVFAWATLPG